MLALMQGVTPQGITDDNMPSPGTPSGISDAIFARQLRRVREAAKLTQQQLADVLASTGNKIHRSTIGKIENGDRPVTVGEATQIAEILGVDLAALLTEPPADLDKQEAMAMAALGAAERELHYAMGEREQTRAHAASAQKTADAADHRAAEAEIALKNARHRLGLLQSHVPNPRTIQPKE